MSCFRVASSFKSTETIEVTGVIRYFHFPAIIFLQLPQNHPPLSTCSSVSVVSIYIAFIIATTINQKVLEPTDRGRVMLISGRQDYTSRLQPAAPSLSEQPAVFAVCAGYLEEEAWW